MSTVTRIQLDEINDINNRQIDKAAGVYVIHCPKTGYTKFGRASNLRSRITQYKSMCFNGGGVVVLYKVMSPHFIVTAEKVLLSIATTKLRHIDKNEYFMCVEEATARNILEQSLLYLTKYHIMISELIEPVIATIGTSDVTSVRRKLADLVRDMQAVLMDAKEHEHIEIYHQARTN
jgi:hypothetical protein